MRNPTWERDELILALHLYFTSYRDRLPRSRNDPRLAELSAILRALPVHAAEDRQESFRNSNSVNSKLANFRAIDPEREGGRPAHGQNDESVWREFAGRPDALEREVRRVLAALPPWLPAWSALGERTEGSGTAEEMPAWNDSHMVEPIAALPAALSAGTLAEVRRIVDRAAAQRAMARFAASGWRPEDVSDRADYAVHCTRGARETRRVAAFGVLDASAGALLPAGAAELARSGELALFLLIEPSVAIRAPGVAEVSGGRERLDDPWRPRPRDLAPAGFRVSVS